MVFLPCERALAMVPGWEKRNTPPEGGIGAPRLCSARAVSSPLPGWRWHLGGGPPGCRALRRARTLCASLDTVACSQYKVCALRSSRCVGSVQADPPDHAPGEHVQGGPRQSTMRLSAVTGAPWTRDPDVSEKMRNIFEARDGGGRENGGATGGLD